MTGNRKHSHTYIRPPSSDKSAGTKKSVPVTVRTDKLQVQNNAGGWVYSVDDVEALKRFMVLGAGGTYYKSSKDVILENLKTLDRWIGVMPAEQVVNLFVEMRPRVPKASTLLACVAYSFRFGSHELKRALGANISRICWTGDDLFHLVDYSKKFGRGWGRSYSRAIRNWYHSKPNSKLVKQLVKYQGRYGWTQRDVLKLASVYPLNAGMDAAFAYIVSRIRGGEERRERAIDKVKFAYASDDSNGDTADAMEYLMAIEKMWEYLGAGDVDKAIDLAGRYEFPWELFPTEMLRDWRLWDDHLLNVIGPRALLRQLNRLTIMGLAEKPSTLRKVLSKFDDREWCQGAHPASFVIALHQYASGKGGEKGDSRWNPIPAVVKAVEKGFLLSYDAHSILGEDPGDKRIIVAIDVSPSMSNENYSRVDGMGGMLARDVAAIMGGLFLRGEASGAVIPLKFSSRTRGGDGITRINADNTTGLLEFRDMVSDDSGWGGTDCSLPVVWATKNGVFAEVFMLLTDSETWVGKHPNVALEDYRRNVNPNAKMIVVAAAPNKATIADPRDLLSMNCVGFDLATPQIVEGFMRGDLVG